MLSKCFLKNLIQKEHFFVFLCAMAHALILFWSHCCGFFCKSPIFLSCFFYKIRSMVPTSVVCGAPGPKPGYQGKDCLNLWADVGDIPTVHGVPFFRGTQNFFQALFINNRIFTV